MKAWNFGTYRSMEDGKGKSEKKFQITEETFFILYFLKEYYTENIYVYASILVEEKCDQEW